MPFIQVTVRPYLVSIDNSNNKNVIPYGLLKKLKSIILDLIETCFWEDSSVLGFSPVRVDREGKAIVIVRLSSNSNLNVRHELENGPFEDTIYEGDSALVKFRGKKFFVDFRYATIDVKSIHCKKIPTQLLTPSWLIC